MSENRRSFIDLALSGEILDPGVAINDFIERWHRQGSDLPLHEWLGFSWEEYSVFVEKPRFLRAILMARMDDIPLQDALAVAADDAFRLAARGIPQSEIPRIRAWLERTGRL